MSEKLEPQQKMNSEFLKPCFLEKIRKNWSLKFGRTEVDRKGVTPILSMQSALSVLIVGGPDILNGNLEYMDTSQSGFVNPQNTPKEQKSIPADCSLNSYTKKAFCPMHPEKTRMSSDFVYVTPPESTTYTYHDAVDYCVVNHNAGLPSIKTREEAFDLIASQRIDLGGNY